MGALNKKQGVIAWLMILLTAVSTVYVIVTFPASGITSTVVFYYSLSLIFIVGGLIVYALRDKKK